MRERQVKTKFRRIGPETRFVDVTELASPSELVKAFKIVIFTSGNKSGQGKGVIDIKLNELAVGIFHSKNLGI